MMSLVNDRQIKGLLVFMDTMHIGSSIVRIKQTNLGKSVVEYPDDNEYLKEYIYMLARIDEAS